MFPTLLTTLGLFACTEDSLPTDDSPFTEDSGYSGTPQGTTTPLESILLPQGNKTCQDPSYTPAGVDPTQSLVVDLSPSHGDYQTIQDAIAYTEHDSQYRSILVCPGVYAEQISVLTPDIDLVGLGGASETTIDASLTDSPGATNAFFVGAEGVLVDGFTIRGVEYDGRCFHGALSIDNELEDAGPYDPVTIQHVVVEDNAVCRAGGIAIRGTLPTKILNSQIHSNTSIDAGAPGIDIRCDEAHKHIIENVDIAFNHVGNFRSRGQWFDSGGGLRAVPWYGEALCQVEIRNSQIYDNSSMTGIPALYFGAEFLFRHKPIVSYTNVYGNTDTMGNPVDDLNANPIGFAAVGNTQADPLYQLAEDPFSFELADSSPSLDAGDPAEQYQDVDGTRNDQGSYGGPLGNWR